jgi:lipopolysaccharide/colanic/teichoic acid biosynthesis glycosyltransferase
VRPGLSGIGSIVFRNEELILADSQNPDQVYDHMVMPYKGKLEEWYVKHQSVSVYFCCVALTVWVVIFPSSNAVWRVFPTLPAPPNALAEHLGWCERS